jgi:subtilase family serine protease
VTTVKDIRKWARENRLRVSEVSANRLLVRLSGSSTAIARALRTSFASFDSRDTGSFFQVTRAARLPNAFADQVSAVMGLSNLSKFSVPRPAVRTAAALSRILGTANGLLPTLGLSAASLNYPAAYGPKSFWSMYDAPSSEIGSGQQLAIITEGDVSCRSRPSRRPT